MLYLEEKTNPLPYLWEHRISYTWNVARKIKEQNYELSSYYRLLRFKQHQNLKMNVSKSGYTKSRFG